MKKLFLNYFLCCCFLSSFVFTELTAQTKPTFCNFDKSSFKLTKFDCNTVKKTTTFTLLFNQPQGGSGRYGLFYENRIIGTYRGKVSQKRININALTKSLIPSGNRRFSIRDLDNKNCETNFTINVPGCKGELRIYGTRARCTNTRPSPTAELSKSKAPQISFLVQATNFNRLIPRHLSVYIRTKGKDQQVGIARLERKSSRVARYRFNNMISDKVSGKTVFTVVGQPLNDRLDGKPRKLNPNDFYFFKQVTIDVPNCATCSIDLGRVSPATCNNGYVNFRVEFKPTNGSGKYNLYDGSTLIGQNSSILDVESIENHNSIYAKIVGPVTAGTKKIRLVDADDAKCYKEFDVTVPDCSCNISNIVGKAECMVAGATVLNPSVGGVSPAATAVDATATATGPQAPFVTFTFDADGPYRYAAYSIDKDGFPVYFGETRAISVPTTSTNSSTSDPTPIISHSISQFLNTGQTGNVTFYIVDQTQFLIQLSESSTLTGPPRLTLAQLLASKACIGMKVVNIPDCGDDDMDGIVNEDDDCDDNIDSDGDKVPDCKDGCPSDFFKTAPGDCGCNVSDEDSDGDGIKDCFDLCDNRIDSDGDGTNDCIDECPNDPTKTIEDACGCGEPDQTDSDGDGIINCMDPCPYDLNQYVDGRLECGKTKKSDTYLGDRVTLNYGDCSDINFDGRELFYKFTLYDAGALTIRFKEIGSGSRELELFILNDYCFIESCIGNIPGNPGTEESLVLEDLEAGDYYFAVDSRSFYDRAKFELTVDCGVGAGGSGSIVSCAEDALISEDFEGYEVGTDIVTASENFELFGATSISANVMTTQGETPNKAIYFNRSQGASDINFVVGHQVTGVARIAWNMYVAPSKGATFNIFGHESTVSFGADYQIDTDDEDLQGKWMSVEAFIDLDNNQYTLFLDNRAVVETGDYLMGLARINFYAYWNNEFYIDNLCYSMVESVPSVSRVTSIENTLLENIIMPTAATTTISDIETDYETNATTNTASTFVNDLTVYPNPTKGLLNVNLSLEKEMNMTLDLVDPIGRTIKTISIAKTSKINEQLNVSDLANGLYILRAYNKEVVLTKRIIKQ